MRNTTANRILAGAALLLLAGCGGPSRFLDPEADLPYYERVGIIPFTTLSQDRAGGYRVTDVFFSELLQSGFAEVAEPGQFYAAMARTRGGTPPENVWSTEDLHKLGEEAKVQAVFLGTVREYGMVQRGRDAVPSLGLEVRLVDTASGRLVWSASRDETGGSGFPILGWGRDHSLGTLTTRVCRELVQALPLE